jgi:hypothetical protein
MAWPRSHASALASSVRSGRASASLASMMSRASVVTNPRSSRHAAAPELVARTAALSHLAEVGIGQGEVLAQSVRVDLSWQSFIRILNGLGHFVKLSLGPNGDYMCDARSNVLWQTVTVANAKRICTLLDTRTPAHPPPIPAYPALNEGLFLYRAMGCPHVAGSGWPLSWSRLTSQRSGCARNLPNTGQQVHGTWRLQRCYGPNCLQMDRQRSVSTDGSAGLGDHSARASGEMRTSADVI